jgi:uncharacterized protein
MKQLSFFISLVLLAIVFNLPAQAIIIRHDRDDARYKELGRRYSSGLVYVSNGEGTLIAPQWVLTAAHVARYLKSGHAMTINGKLYPSESITLHPKWLITGRSEHDIALIKLREPVTEVSPIALYRQKDELGKAITIIGRGMFGTGLTGPQPNSPPELRGATNVIDAVTEELIKFKFESPDDPKVTDLEGVAAPGDSGGPAFWEAGGKLYLVGVSSDQERGGAGWREGVYGVTEKYVRVSGYLNWIEETMRTPVPADLPRQPFMGTVLDALTPEIRERLKIPAEQNGLLITRVTPGSSAADAGILADDVILRVNEANVGSANSFIATIRNFRVGDKFQLTILRGGEQQMKTITLKPRPFETSTDFDVLYRSVDTRMGRRRVIVTKPKTPGKVPAVLLVGGIGCYSLDNFAPDHAYRGMLYGLTNQGFATMRVEKSGMGDSEGPPCQSSQADLRQEIEGYVAGLRALKTYDFVDADKVFIFGHSIGGIVGPAVAAEEKVRGLVVSETVGTNWFEYALENFRRQAVLRNMPYEAVENDTRVYRDCKQKLWLEKKTPEEIRRENPACSEFVRDPAPYTYMQQLTELNFAEMWKKVSAPTLIIYGTSDFLTSAAEHEYLRDMVNKFRPNTATYVEIPQMDHYLVRAASQQESMQRFGNPQAAAPPFDERILNEALKWLKQIIN